MFHLSPTSQVVVVIPEVPGFAGNIKDTSALKTIMAAQYRTINRGGNSIYESVRKAGFDPYVLIAYILAIDITEVQLVGWITFVSTIFVLTTESMHPIVRPSICFSLGFWV